MLPLSLALTDLPADTPDPFRAQLAFARDAGYRAVHLNAAAAGLRPRELGRSARRDLASLLKRSELAISGADLWIPPQHFSDPAHADRAVAAVLAAIEFIADIDRLLEGSIGRTLCITLPKGVNDAVLTTMTARAVDCGARVADFGAGVEATVPGVLGPGFDPAAALLASPGATLATAAGTMQLPRGLVAARLTDAGPFGRVHVGAPGSRLDLLPYVIALTTSGYSGHVIADVRGLADPLAGAKRARESWQPIAP